jgi:hypothetical protein
VGSDLCCEYPHFIGKRDCLLFADQEVSGQMKFVPILCKTRGAHAVNNKIVTFWDVIPQSLVNM